MYRGSHLCLAFGLLDAAFANMILPEIGISLESEVNFKCPLLSC